MELLALQRVRRLPPHLFFVASSVFHYLGPAVAVLLFARLSVSGVVLLRIGSAAAVFAVWKRPIAIAAVFGAYEITKVVGDPVLLFAGIGVGICSSVLPDVCDQLAMARLPRSSFALFLSLLPATATVIGIIVLRQVPSEREIIGVALVIAGITAHQPPDSQEPKNCL
jgi:inner membrane transporter RhtA